MDLTLSKKRTFIFRLATVFGCTTKEVVRLYTLSTIDPTKSIMLRRAFEGDAYKRLRKLKGDIRKSIIDDDCFGLQPNKFVVYARTGGKRFAYVRDTAKVDGFMEWLEEQHKTGILEVTTIGVEGPQPWSNKYIQSSYQKGLQQAQQKLLAGGIDIPLAPGGITGGFYAPFHADRVALIFTRVFGELKGVTAAMDQQISRILARGLAEGKGPYELARQLNDRVDKIGISRAQLIARTEIVQTLNVAALNEFEAMETMIDEPIFAQWITAQDERVRGSHAARHGRVYKRQDAQPLLGEPNCRCALIPYIESVHGEVSPAADIFGGSEINLDNPAQFELMSDTEFKGMKNFVPKGAEDYKYSSSGGLSGNRFTPYKDFDIDSREHMLRRASRGRDSMEVKFGDVVGKQHDEIMRIINGDKFTLSKDITLGFGMDSEGIASIAKYLDEGILEFQGARHLGTNLARVANYARVSDITPGAIFRVKIPKGSKAVFAEVFELNEVVLMPGSKMKIISKTTKTIIKDGKKSKVLFIDAELIEDGTAFMKDIDAFKNRIHKIAKQSKSVT